MIRLFAAVAIPDEIGQDLVARQRDLPGARWRPADSLHITLRFFGEIEESTADDLDAAMSQVDGPPLTVSLLGAGAFGDGPVLRAIWAGVADNPPLKRLARRCEISARRAGLQPDRRAYRPHVTLAYLSRPEPARVAAWIQANNLLKSPSFAVEAFGVYSSWPISDGSRYRLEQTYPLRHR